MNAHHLARELLKMPNHVLSFWCPDGYEDSIIGFKIANDEIILTGYNATRPNSDCTIFGLVEGIEK